MLRYADIGPEIQHFPYGSQVDAGKHVRENAAMMVPPLSAWETE
jgi:hypothetical protein